MKITVLTMFPNMFDDFLKEPVIRRAVSRGIVSISIEDIKKYAGGSFRHIDDDTYGGGAGMVMRAQPVLDALKAVSGTGLSSAGSAQERPEVPEKDPAKSSKDNASPFVCVMTPCGRLYSQRMARQLAEKEHLVFICGHYEGIDERVMKYADTQISIGDYVLTGGELPAKVVMDSVIRLLDGVLRRESTDEESFEQGLLEYPQYTKPPEVEGDRVPGELLTGDHRKIRRWRLKMSLLRTLRRRPDLLERRGLSDEERRILKAEELTEQERACVDRLPAVGCEKGIQVRPFSGRGET